MLTANASKIKKIVLLHITFIFNVISENWIIFVSMSLFYKKKK